MKYDEMELIRRMTEAFDGLPILERLEYVRELLFNDNGDPDDEDADPIKAIAVTILDEVIYDVVAEPRIRHFPRSNREPGWQRPRRPVLALLGRPKPSPSR